ncbi:hypothetical protein VE03_04341 [Pseudogymnoascus sp. 23342-1-I1]|nr:hypothetical protein VE03_04341 [Pseudogymnoascus sp. 23342-1-I1]
MATTIAVLVQLLGIPWTIIETTKGEKRELAKRRKRRARMAKDANTKAEAKKKDDRQLRDTFGKIVSPVRPEIQKGIQQSINFIKHEATSVVKVSAEVKPNADALEHLVATSEGDSEMREDATPLIEKMVECIEAGTGTVCGAGVVRKR